MPPVTGTRESQAHIPAWEPAETLLSSLRHPEDRSSLSHFNFLKAIGFVPKIQNKEEL